MCWMRFCIIILEPWFRWFIVKFTAFLYPYFVWYAIRLISYIFSKNINNTIKIEILYYIYLLNTYPQDQPPQVLSLKDEYTFRFSNFLIIVLRNSSINCWFGIFLIFNSSLLRLPKVYEYALGPAPSEVFISKTLQTIEAIQRWYPSYFGFLATLNALSRNN